MSPFEKAALPMIVGDVDHGEVMAHLLGFGDIMRVVVAEGIHTVAVGKGLVPMLQGVAVWVEHFKKTIVA